MTPTPSSARKTIAAVLSAALLVSAPGPLAVSALAQTMNAGAVRAASGVSGVSAASLNVPALAPSALIPTGAPGLSPLAAPSAAAAPVSAAPALAAAVLPAAPAAALAAAVPVSAPALAPAPAAAPVTALKSGRDLGARLDAAAVPGSDGNLVATALDSFYNGVVAAAPCIFADMARKREAARLNPSDAAAGTPANGIPPAPAGPASARFQVSPVHYAAMRAMAAVWSVWDRAIDSKWDKMPPLLGEIYLYFNEQSLRLHVWDANALPTTEKSAYGPATEEQKTARSADGSYFDDQKPGMAKAGTRWNQLNTPEGGPNPHFDKMEPNPLLVSQVLDKRDVDAEGRPVTKEAGILNDWSAAEIQAQVHDWGNHLRQPISDNPIRIKIPAGHPLGAADRETEMVLDRTEKDPTLPADYAGPAVHRNAETPGWDMSNIYGSSFARQMQVRSLHDGKMKIGADGRLLEDPEKPGLPLTGFNDNMTPLLAMYHTIWTLEHNAVADAVKSEHPDWNDQQIFNMARLRVTALNARIHTVEWTRALLPHPTLHAGMWADWYGFLGKPLKLWVMRFSDRNPRMGLILGKLLRYELIFGVPGTSTQHYGKNYAFVEEFFDVYRLHTMIRDWNKIQRLGASNELIELDNLSLKDALGYKTVETLKTYAPEDFALSYGMESAGALTLNNAPDALRDLTTQDGRRIDLTAVDVIRTRERLHASRYSDFVRRLGERPPKTFLELTGGNAEAAAKLASVYKTVDEVDFQPGIRAERKPDAFALGNRQFKPFVLSAPARLKNDRFLSEEYNAKTYGASGMEYIEHTNFSHLLLRHYPSLRPVVQGLDNSFRPWDKPGTLNDRLATNAAKSFEKSLVYAAWSFLSGLGIAALTMSSAAVAPLAALIAVPTAAFFVAAWLNDSVRMTAGGTMPEILKTEKDVRRASLALKIGAFALMDVGGMIAYHLFAAHPVGALLIGAVVVVRGIGTLRNARRASEDATALRVGVAAKLTADRPRTDPKDIRGNNAIEKRYWVMMNGKEGSVLHFGDTYGTLRASGLPALTAFMTATMWHLPFARQTWANAPEQKAALKPGFFDIYIPGLIETQKPSNNRVFADGSKPGVKRGDVDMAEFDRLFRDFGMHDDLTAYDLARIREANQHRDALEGKGTWFSRLIGRYAAKRRADQLIELFADRVVWEDGADGRWVPAISRAQLLRFYQGGAQYDLIRDRSGK
jgi:hypothetical protein